MDGQARSWRFGGLGLVLAGLLLVCPFGCSQWQGMSAAKQDGQVKRLEPRTVPYLNGVPVPSGFRMSGPVTRAFEANGVRFAQQEYSGSADAFAVREFYKEQMPLVGWREVSSQNIKGRLTMRFESATEECTVGVEPSGWFNRSTIDVVVQPFNRNVSEPPKRAMP